VHFRVTVHGRAEDLSIDVISLRSPCSIKMPWWHNGQREPPARPAAPAFVREKRGAVISARIKRPGFDPA